MARDYHSVIECGHALGANRHGREVVQQGRGRGGKYPEETCGQERRVEGNIQLINEMESAE